MKNGVKKMYDLLSYIRDIAIRVIIYVLWLGIMIALILSCRRGL